MSLFAMKRDALDATDLLRLVFEIERLHARPFELHARQGKTACGDRSSSRIQNSNHELQVVVLGTGIHVGGIDHKPDDMFPDDLATPSRFTGSSVAHRVCRAWWAALGAP